MREVNTSPDPLLSVEDLRTYCYTRSGVVKAVDGVTFQLEKGDSLGLVGESGSGKSMTCNSIIRLLPKPAARTVGGRVMWSGRDILQLPERKMRRIRGSEIGMILQDPLMSLNPVFTISDQVGEPFRLRGAARNRAELREMTLDVLRQVHIPSPELRLSQYPFEFSGGMRQRTGAAIALAGSPGLLIADEPTTSLDVTIQDQFLQLLRELQANTGMALILVTHDLGIVAETCNKVAVMYAGKIVEMGDVRQVLTNPAHPYTEALLKALPLPGKREKRLYQISGEPPNMLDPPKGCPFAPRCHKVMTACETTPPPMQILADGHRAACLALDRKAVVT